MKKSFAALKLQGLILMTSIVSLIGVLLIKQYNNPKQHIEPVATIKFNNYVDAFNLTLTSYGFFNKIFPVLCEM